MNILVLGGAGYIGSHLVKTIGRGTAHRAVAYDNLVYGHPEAVGGAVLHRGNIGDRERMTGVLKAERIDVVMHFAAYTYVGESVEDPARYYLNNVVETIHLLDSMRDAGVRKIVFSSSCAVFGVPVSGTLGEDHPRDPINPYGASKLMVERILADYRRAYGIEYVALRYFNAAGADRSAEIGEDHSPETHLIPLAIMAALGKRESIRVFGTDYPTPDGTCVRDYIHVTDLARAHCLAMDYLCGGGESTAFNLGTGRGYSVREVIETTKEVSGREFRVVEAGRRAGDPERLVAASTKAGAVLGWRPEIPELREIVRTAWAWHSSRPNGYKG